jgi:hypothetical protein
MTILLRCQCGNNQGMNLLIAERCFGPRPADACEASADCCPRCAPSTGIYPCGWVKPAVSGQEGSSHG